MSAVNAEHIFQVLAEIIERREGVKIDLEIERRKND